MTAQEFIDSVTLDLQRIDGKIKKLEAERRFAAHMADAAETFKRNNEPGINRFASQLREIEAMLDRLTTSGNSQAIS